MACGELACLGYTVTVLALTLPLLCMYLYTINNILYVGVNYNYDMF